MTTNGDKQTTDTQVATKEFNCACGFNTTDDGDFRKHLMQGGKKDGKGVHKSLKAQNPSKTETPRQPMLGKVDDIKQAVRIRIVPKEFIVNTMMLWQAMEVAINEWGWPEDIKPDDFLDTYLYYSYKQRGVVLGGYQVMESKAEVS